MTDPGQSWEMHAHRYDDGRFHTIGSERYVRMHGLKGPILRVLVEEVPEGDTVTHWGWMGFAYQWHEADTEPCMIWHTRGQLEMCFPYGTKAEAERGHGRVVFLRITEIPPS